jgi:hypothetical protein
MAALIFFLLNLGARYSSPRAYLKQRCRAQATADCAAARPAYRYHGDIDIDAGGPR